MKKKVLIIIVSLVSGFAAFMAIGWKFYDIMIRTKKKEPAGMASSGKKVFRLRQIAINHPRNGYEEKYESGKAWCMQQKMKDCYINSFDGLRLHASYLEAPEAKRTILLSHGYRGSGFGDFANTAQFLHEHGCNLLFIDQRCHGQSEGESVTFGALENRDVAEWMRFLSGQNQEKLPLYMYGESMGGAAVLMASERILPKETRGIISDCALHSMKGQLESMAANWFHLKYIPLLLFRVDLFCRWCSGFSIKDADTTRALRQNKIPILFFHGKKDTFVSYQNTLSNYRLCKAPKELMLVSDVRHLCSAYVEEDRYRKKLLQFFDKYDIPA